MEEIKERDEQVTQSKFLNIQLSPGSYGGLTATYMLPGDADFANNEACQTCIETNATYCSKAFFKSVLVRSDGTRSQDYKSLDRLLQVRPNPTMCASVFWERVAYYYYAYNNSFIFKECDKLGNIIALWSLDPSRVEFAKIETGEIIMRFVLNGVEYREPYSNLIHISRMAVDNLMFGRSVSPAILKVMKLIDLNYDGIEKAIVYSQFIRFVAETTTRMSEEDLIEKAKRFSDAFLKIGDKSPVGVAAVDSTMKLTPVANNKQDRANYAEVEQWNRAIYKFYGTNEAVLNGTADENGMIAYYERTIEPFFIRTAQELTHKVFTKREYEVGNRIEFDDMRLTYRSMATKLQIFNSARELGAFTLGTLGDLLGLPVPAEKRGEIVVSQNYYDSTKANNHDTDNDSGAIDTDEEET